MNYTEKCQQLTKLEFKSPEWMNLYIEIVKDTYKFEDLYVILNPKKIDYDFEVGLPYVTKLNDTASTLLFTSRENAEKWIEKYGSGKNFIGHLHQSMFNEFFARCVLLKVNVSTVNIENDAVGISNADMVNINGIPTQINIEIPDELKGKENLTLSDLNVDLPLIPVHGALESNDSVEHMQLLEHIDVEVAALMKDDDVLVNNKVHVFLNSKSVNEWIQKHKNIASEYKVVHDSVGMLAYNALKREESKGIVVDGLAPFQLFAAKDDLEKIGPALVAFTVFNAKNKGKINGSQAKEMLYNEEFYACVDNSVDGCGYDYMVRDGEHGKFNAVQLYVSEESADKFNMSEHEIVKVILSDVLSKTRGYGLIFEPYSHYWIQIEPNEL